LHKADGCHDIQEDSDGKVVIGRKGVGKEEASSTSRNSALGNSNFEDRVLWEEEMYQGAGMLLDTCVLSDHCGCGDGGICCVQARW
jgi:hypothetical protein